MKPEPLIPYLFHERYVIHDATFMKPAVYGYRTVTRYY